MLLRSLFGDDVGADVLTGDGVRACNDGGGGGGGSAMDVDNLAGDGTCDGFNDESNGDDDEDDDDGDDDEL